MPETTNLVDTPRYLLKSGSQAIFPTINNGNRDTSCVCVYGFSNKRVYDEFIKGTEHLLTPFPLLQRYMANQIAESESDGSGARLALVILDAAGLEDPTLSAATMADVILAQQEKTKQVQAEFRLAYDANTNEYRFDDNDTEPRAV